MNEEHAALRAIIGRLESTEAKDAAYRIAGISGWVPSLYALYETEMAFVTDLHRRNPEVGKFICWRATLATGRVGEGQVEDEAILDLLFNLQVNKAGNVYA